MNRDCSQTTTNQSPALVILYQAIGPVPLPFLRCWVQIPRQLPVSVGPAPRELAFSQLCLISNPDLDNPYLIGVTPGDEFQYSFSDDTWRPTALEEQPLIDPPSFYLPLQSRPLALDAPSESLPSSSPRPSLPALSAPGLSTTGLLSQTARALTTTAPATYILVSAEKRFALADTAQTLPRHPQTSRSGVQAPIIFPAIPAHSRPCHSPDSSRVQPPAAIYRSLNPATRQSGLLLK
jgi:hypothetical protein